MVEVEKFSLPIFNIIYNRQKNNENHLDNFIKNKSIAIKIMTKQIQI